MLPLGKQQSVSPHLPLAPKYNNKKINESIDGNCTQFFKMMKNNFPGKMFLLIINALMGPRSAIDFVNHFSLH